MGFITYHFQFSFCYLYPRYPWRSHSFTASLPQGASSMSHHPLPHLATNLVPTLSLRFGIFPSLGYIVRAHITISMNWAPVFMPCHCKCDTRYPQVEIVPLLSSREGKAMVQVLYIYRQGQLGLLKDEILYCLLPTEWEGNFRRNLGQIFAPSEVRPYHVDTQSFSPLKI